MYVWGTEIMQPVFAAHSLGPVTFLSFLHVVFPALTAFRFRIFICLFIMNICFIEFFLFILQPCRSGILGLFTLSISLLFDFISSFLLSFFLDIISFFSDKKERRYFFQLIIFSAFSAPH